MHDDTQSPDTTALPIEIDDVIAHLAAQQAQFASYLDRHWDDLGVHRLARLLSLYGQNATRLGRLLRDRGDIYGDDYDRLKAVVEKLEKELEDELRAEQEGVEPDTDTPTSEDEPISCEPPVLIDAVITDLADRQVRLSQYLDRCWHGPDVEHIDRLLAIYSHNAIRLGRLLRDRCAMHGRPPDPVEAMWDAALDEINALGLWSRKL
jgi:hypothetical protein